jgi:16S rRNA processing protein RimM
MSGGMILVGVVGAPHGVKGELRLKSFTADPLAIADYGPLTDSAGGTLLLTKVRLLKDDMLVVKFDGINDRDQAAKLTRRELYVLRSQLPPPDEDEFYFSDLIGLHAKTVAGDAFGTVVAVENFGAGDLIEIEQADKSRVLLPFTKAVVPHVDLAGRVVTIDPPVEIEVRGEDDETSAP